LFVLASIEHQWVIFFHKKKKKQYVDCQLKIMPSTIIITICVILAISININTSILVRNQKKICTHIQSLTNVDFLSVQILIFKNISE